MSVLNRFKFSAKQMFFGSLFVLLGVLLGSVFIRISSASLIMQFGQRYASFYDTMTWTNAVSIFLKELSVLFLMTAAVYFPYGQIAALCILFYKGFCIGIVAAISCWQFKALGIKYILLLILPQNLIYIFALLAAAQITFSQINGRIADSSKHTKVISSHKYSYIFCYCLQIMGVLTETIAQPFIYKLFF